MRKFLSVARLLLLCLAMYVLLVLPVFAAGYYTNHAQYSGGYPVNYPGKAQGAMYRAPHPAYAPTYYIQDQVYNTQQVAQTAPMRRLNDYSPHYQRSQGQGYRAPTYNQPQSYRAPTYNQPQTRQMRRGYAPNPYYQTRPVTPTYTDAPRLQFDALNGPTQMITNGRPVQDPALVYLPPLYPQKSKRRATSPKYNSKQGVQSKTQEKKVTPVTPSAKPVPTSSGTKNVSPPKATEKRTPVPSNTLTNSPGMGVSRPTSGQAPAATKPTTPSLPPAASTFGTAPTAAPYEGSAPSVGNTAGKK